MEGPSVAAASRARHTVTVRAGGELLAMPLDRVRRVVRGVRIHPLPGASQAVLGLARYGGEPLVVVDLGTVRTGVAPASRDRRTVVIADVGEDPRETVGLAVDEARAIEPEAEAGVLLDLDDLDLGG